MTKALEQAIIGYWGERCADFDANCPCCKAWSELDALSRCSVPTVDAEAQRLAEIVRDNRRETFEAMCAMRDTINEYVPLPSLESDLLESPENSVFCAKVAEGVVAHIEGLNEKLERAMEALEPNRELLDFIERVSGALLGLAMSGNNHPSPEGVMMDLSREGMSLASKSRARALLPDGGDRG